MFTVIGSQVKKIFKILIVASSQISKSIIYQEKIIKNQE